MSEEKKHRKFRWGRLILWLFLSLLLVIIGSSTYLFVNSNKLINKHLPGYIYTKTDSIYRVSFDSLHVDLKKRSLHVEHLHIVPDSMHSTDSSKTYYEFKTKHLDLDKVFLFSLIRDKKFRANSFKVEHPYFSTNKNKKLNFKNLRFPEVKKGDSLSLPLLKEIFLDTILVIDAELELDTLLSTIKSFPTVNLEVTHFKLGGKKYTDTPYPFDVSDISLNVKNLNQNLPDSLHVVKIEQINLSLLNSTIRAQNISLQPNTDTLTFENRYRFKMPEMRLETDHIDELLTRDSLYFNNVTLVQPEIEVRFGTRVAKGTPLNEINLHKIIEKSIKLIAVDQFSIENANVSFIPNQSDSVTQKFETLFIKLYDFQSDKNSHKQSDRFLSAKNASLSLRKFTLAHTDKVHKLTIKNIKANTSDQRVSTEEIIFAPTSFAVKSKVNSLVDVQCKGLVFKNVDFLEVYHNQLLPMDELLIKPSATKITYKQKHKRKRKKDKSLILEKLEDYLRGIYVDKTTIQKSHLEYQYSTSEEDKGFFKTDYTFNLDKLSVDSATFYQSDKIFFAENFDINFSDIQLQLADEKHRLFAANVKLSSEGKSATINDLKVSPVSKTKNQDATFDIHFPRIKLNGANLHHAFFNNELYIANLNVNKPVFNIDKEGAWISGRNNENLAYESEIYKLMSDYLEKIQIRRLSMDNGTLNFSHQLRNKPNFELSNLFSVKLENFVIDKKAHLRSDKLFFSDNIDLILKNHSFTLADGVHKVRAAEIGILSSSNRVYISEGRLYPDILSSEFKNLPITVFATIPDMQIKDADIFGLFNHGILNVSTVDLNKPEIKIMFQDTEKKNVEDAKKPVFLLEDLKTFSSAKINISQGKLELANYVNHQSNSFIETDVDFAMDGLTVRQENQTFSTAYRNFDVALKNVRYDLPDNLHVINLASFDYSLNTENIDAGMLTLKPSKGLRQSDRKQYYELEIPRCRLTGFDFDAYLETEQLDFDAVHLEAPKFSIKDQRIEQSGDFTPYDLSIYQKIKKFAKQLSANQLKINNASINYDGDKDYQYSNIDINSSNFLVDEAGTNKNKLLQADKTNLHLKKISGKTRDGYFNYLFDELYLDDSGNFSIENISLQPVLSEKEFARRVKFQENYFNIIEAKAKGTNLQLKELVENGALFIDELDLSVSKVKIHRDKNYPRDPNHLPKLPQQLIRDIKNPLNIQRVSLNVDRFDYTEYESGSTRKSLIYFEDGKVFLTNITNVKERLDANQYMDVIINGKLMGVGNTQVKMKYNVPSFGNEFTVEAICEDMPLAALNSITEPSLNVSIKEGYNQKLDVYFEANEDSAVGEMKFAYKDLKISVLRGDELKEDKLISFLLNSIAVKSDNPKPGRILLPVKFVRHRDKQRSVIGYSWQSIFKGIKVTLGLKEKNEGK